MKQKVLLMFFTMMLWFGCAQAQTPNLSRLELDGVGDDYVGLKLWGDIADSGAIRVDIEILSTGAMLSSFDTVPTIVGPFGITLRIYGLEPCTQYRAWALLTKPPSPVNSLQKAFVTTGITAIIEPEKSIEPDEKVEVYSADGRRVIESAKNSEVYNMLWNPGLYIVRSLDFPQKIMKIIK